MSVDLFLFLAEDVPLNTNVLNEIVKNSHPTVIYEKKIDLNEHSGYLPITIDGVSTGVEVYKVPFINFDQVLPRNPKLDLNNAIVIHFRWGSNFMEGAAAFYTASLYTAKFNGVAYDPQSNVYLSLDELRKSYEIFRSYASKE